MKKMRLRLTTAGPTAFVLMLMLSFGILGAISANLGNENIRQSIRAFSRPIVKVTARSLFNPLYQLDVVQMNTIISQYVGDEVVVYISVYNQNGRKVIEAPTGWEADSELGKALALQAIDKNQQVEREDGNFLTISSPIGVGTQVIGAVEFVFNQQKLRADFGSQQSVILFYTAGIMLATTLLSFFSIRAALLPLSNLAVSARRIGEGDLETPIPVKGAYEIASLAESLETMRADLVAGYKKLQEVLAGLEQQVAERTAIAESARTEAESARRNLEEEIWQVKGQTQLADVMRGEQSISQLAENIIAQLCVYMDVHSGALFLSEEDTLSLAGAYAFSGGAGFTGRISLGSGLIGQAARDGTPLVLNHLDANTRVLSSGLADFSPRSVVAFPISANQQVIGVIEMASLFELTEKHFELLNRLSEQIGVAFVSAQNRLRVHDLLSKSQQQAEELIAQEEELRAANEELQAQADYVKNKKRSKT